MASAYSVKKKTFKQLLILLNPFESEAGLNAATGHCESFTGMNERESGGLLKWAEPHLDSYNCLTQLQFCWKSERMTGTVAVMQVVSLDPRYRCFIFVTTDQSGKGMDSSLNANQLPWSPPSRPVKAQTMQELGQILLFSWF